jgi:hypothetical protein
VVGLATIALAGVGLALPSQAATEPSATDVTLTSGSTLKSTWDIFNDVGTSNGLPAGGECPTPEVPGLGVSDALYDIGGTPKNDAFDNGLLFFVNNSMVIAPATWDVQVDPTDPSLNRVVTSGPTTVGGLSTTVEYRAMPTQQVLRSTVYLSNPGASAVTVPFAVATNVGSDETTVVVGSSSGDATFSDADRWVATSDHATTPGDAVNTHVLAGPGVIAAPPTGTSTTVFDCSETNGVRANYNVTIPAGATRGLMFLNELSGTNAGAVSAAARFNANPAATDELLTGLSDAQRANIVNWRLTQSQQPDGKIRELDSAKYLGNNVYNTTGKRQTVKTQVRRGQTETFRVRLYNDGNARATFAARGISSAKGVRVRYFAGGENVTAEMKSAAGLSFTRSPGKFLKIKVKVKIKGSAAQGSRKFAKVTGSWTGSGLVSSDTVKAVIRVR